MGCKYLNRKIVSQKQVFRDAGGGTSCAIGTPDSYRIPQPDLFCFLYSVGRAHCQKSGVSDQELG